MTSRSRSRSRKSAPALQVETEFEEVVVDDNADNDEQVEEIRKTTGRRRGGSHTSSTIRALLQLRVIHLIVLFIGGLAGLQIYAHYQAFHVINYWHVALTVFLSINAFICWCEICLHCFHGHVAKTHAALEKEFRSNKSAVASRWFLTPITLGNVFGRAWAEMWATYAVFDSSYADNGTYSFWVDSGNGLFTLVPTLLLLCGMTNDLSPVGLTPFWLGLLSFVTFWTEFYGTVLYFWSFFYHGRHRGNSLLDNLRFVVLTNGTWFVMPAIGMYVSTRIMRENSLKFLQH
jgi:hypothetical protein